MSTGNGGGVAIDLQVVGVEAYAAIGELATKLTPGKMQEALDEIGASNVTETQQRFEDEKDPEGNRWQELSDVTKSLRKQPSPRILRDAVHLYDSITHRVNKDTVEVGTNRVYGRIHQLGGMAGRSRKVTIPARPYLGVSRDGEKEIIAIVDDYLTGKA